MRLFKLMKLLKEKAFSRGGGCQGTIQSLFLEKLLHESEESLEVLKTAPRKVGLFVRLWPLFTGSLEKKPALEQNISKKLELSCAKFHSN